MPHYRRSVVLATAMCAMVSAMGSTAALAENAAQQKNPLNASAAFRPSPPSGQENGPHPASAEHRAGLRRALRDRRP